MKNYRVGTGVGILIIAAFVFPTIGWSFSLTAYQAVVTGLTANYVTAVAEDDNGTAWIGTGGGGLVSLDDKGAWAVADPKKGFAAKEVSSIVFDRSQVLVGTELGLFARDKEGQWKAVFEVAGGKLIKPVMTMIGEDLWAGALGPRGGLFHRKADGSWEQIKGPAGEQMNDILALEFDGENLWIGTMNHGLYRYKKGDWKHYDMKAGLPHFYVVDLAWTGKALWAAVPKSGLVKIEGGEIEVVSEQDGLPLKGWSRLCYDSDSESLWVGTDKSGLARYDGRRWITYGKEDGLISLRTFAVAEGGKGIWVGTDVGLVHIVP